MKACGRGKIDRRSFSFKGQKVEYRFKPDGTWETFAMTNPPDDGPKPPHPKADSKRPDRKPLPGPDKPADNTVMAGIIAFVTFLILGVIWYVMRRNKSTGAA